MDNIREEIFEISKLIALELTGSLSAEETARLVEWRGRSGRNEKLYAQMLGGEYLRNGFEGMRDADSWRALEQMRLRIEDKGSRRRTGFGRIIGAVSAAACLVVGLWFVWQSQRDDTVQVAPGPEYPTLTLADGSVVRLDVEQRVVAAEGIVVELSGQRKLVYDVPDDLVTDEQPRTHTISVPKGNSFDIVLGDGTHVWLNADSRISFPARFAGGERRVSIEGEVYFEVTKNQDVPFIVESRGQSVTVYGTEFNVNAYEERVVTTLVNGHVGVSAGNTEMDLTPGEQSVFSERTGQIAKRTVNVHECISWREGYFVLEGQSLQAVMNAIGRWYSVDIVWKEPSLFDMEFEGRLPRQATLKETLDILEMTREVKFTLKGNLIEIGK